MDLRGDIVFCDASQGAYTATLPPASTVGSGYVVAYKKTDASTNVVTIAPAGSESIDGQPSVQLTFPYQSIQMATNGANWFLLPVLPFAGGGVTGPEASTDNALALWDGTDGSAIKNSPWVLDPATGVMTVGGSAPGLVSAGGGDITIQPDGTGRSAVKNLTTSGITVADGAVEGGYDNIGDVSGTATVSAVFYSRIRLTGDTTVTLTEPTASLLAVRMLEVVQDGTGGRVPTFTGFTWIGSEPPWEAIDPGLTGVLGWYVTPTGRKRIWLVEEFA